MKTFVFSGPWWIGVFRTVAFRSSKVAVVRSSRDWQEIEHASPAVVDGNGSQIGVGTFDSYSKGHVEAMK